MPRRKLGIPAKDLSDEALERELRHMWRTREETMMRGGSHALATHTYRMLQLEFEYISRFPQKTTPAASRTRRGSRKRSGQPSGRKR